MYDFFLIEEKKMLRAFELRKKEKDEEIQKWTNLKGKELFEAFNLDEKINNIKINPGLASLSTTINS